MMAGWRERLLEAADADPRSDRKISLDAKLGPNFVNELRNTDKEPGIKKVLRLAEELNVSLATLFIGHEITKEDEEFLGLLDSVSEAERQALLSLLRKQHAASE
jgi:transcriptional regulator with XRE-family HTH domain